MTPAVFTIAAHRAFADALAAGLVARFGREKTGLARGIVLTPNNRAERAIQDAFVRRSGGGLLLPRLVPIGDPELDERLGGALEPLDQDEAIPPAIDPIERQFLLAGLIGRARGIGAVRRCASAADLGRTLDQRWSRRSTRRGWPASLARSPISPGTGRNRSSNCAWSWRPGPSAEGDGSHRSRRSAQPLLDAAAKRWRATPPPGFVCAPASPRALRR